MAIKNRQGYGKEINFQRTCTTDCGSYNRNMCLVFTSELLWLGYRFCRLHCSRYLRNTNREREVMIALTGKPIKEATIEDLRRIEEHIKEYRAKMDGIDNPIAKGYFQMDIDISEKTREVISKELEL